MLLWLIQESLNALEVRSAEHRAPGRAMVVSLKSRFAALRLASLAAPSTRSPAARPELCCKDVEQLGHVSCSSSSIVERLL